MATTRRDLLAVSAGCGTDQTMIPTSIHEIDPNVRCGFPDIPVTSHLGEQLRFYEDVVRDRVFVLNFFSTDDDRLSRQTAKLGDVARALGDMLGRQVSMSSITIDPENDTVERLAEFAAEHNTPPGWRFLRVSGEDAAVLAQRMYRFNRGAAAGMGRLAFYGNGINGGRVWGTFPVGITPEDAVHRIKGIVQHPKGRIPKRAGPAKRDGRDQVYAWSARIRA